MFSKLVFIFTICSTTITLLVSRNPWFTRPTTLSLKIPLVGVPEDVVSWYRFRPIALNPELFGNLTAVSWPCSVNVEVPGVRTLTVPSSPIEIANVSVGSVIPGSIRYPSEVTN